MTTSEKPKPKVRVNQSTERDGGQSKIDREITQVMEDLDKVLTKALSKYKNETAAKKFIALLDKSISEDVATRYVSTRLLLTEKLMNAILPDMIDSITKEAAKFNKLRLEKEANTLFDRETRLVMIKLLGMEEDRWSSGGKLTVDHCNGRESAITKYIKENSQGILDRVMREAIKEFEADVTPKMTKQLQTAITKEVEEQVRRNMWSSTQTYIKQRAEEMSRSLVDNALEKHDAFKTLCSTKSDDE